MVLLGHDSDHGQWLHLATLIRAGGACSKAHPTVEGDRLHTAPHSVVRGGPVLSTLALERKFPTVNMQGRGNERHNSDGHGWTAMLPSPHTRTQAGKGNQEGL